MRALFVVVAAMACGCSTRAHIDLKLDIALDTQCGTANPNNPPPPMRCEDLTVTCADRLLFRVRRLKDDRTAGDTFSSACIKMSEAGNPRDLCELVALREPVSLIDSVPNGIEFIFQLAALRVGDPNLGCDDEGTTPVRVFSGYTDPILVDGKDHQSMLHLKSCGSCKDLPFSDNPTDMSSRRDLGFSPLDQSSPSFDLASGASDLAAYDAATASDMAQTPGGDMSTAPPDFATAGDLAQSLCPPGYAKSDYYPLGGALCCPTPRPAGCLAPGAPCGDGTDALLPPGGCCAVCD